MSTVPTQTSTLPPSTTTESTQNAATTTSGVEVPMYVILISTSLAIIGVGWYYLCKRYGF